MELMNFGVSGIASENCIWMKNANMNNKFITLTQMQMEVLVEVKMLLESFW